MRALERNLERIGSTGAGTKGGVDPLGERLRTGSTGRDMVRTGSIGRETMRELAPLGETSIYYF